MKGKQGKIATASPYPTTISDPRIASLLLDLHRAVDVQSLWEAGCKLLHACMPHYHHLVALPCVGVVPMFLKTTLPLRPIPNYWERFVASDPPLAKIVREKPGIEVSFLSDCMTDEEIMQSRCYQEFMEPDGWFYGTGFLFWEEGNFVGQFSSIRTKAQGDYLPSEREILLQLYPHFSAAVQRVVVLDRERSVRMAAEAGLEQIPDGRVILDWNLRPVFQNHAAQEACLNWTQGTINQPIRAKELTKPFLLPSEIAVAAGTLLKNYRQAISEHALDDKSWKLTLEHPQVPGLSARIQILESKDSQVSEPNVLVELSRIIPSAGGGVAVPFFKLTSSQRRVAELTAAGHTNEEIAKDLSVSVHTVRAHLREVFSKLGISRRSQLNDLITKR